MDIRVRDHMQVLSHKSHNEPSLGPLSLVLSGEKKKSHKHASTHTFLWKKKFFFGHFQFNGCKKTSKWKMHEKLMEFNWSTTT